MRFRKNAKIRSLNNIMWCILCNLLFPRRVQYYVAQNKLFFFVHFTLFSDKAQTGSDNTLIDNDTFVI